MVIDRMQQKGQGKGFSELTTNAAINLMTEDLIWKVLPNEKKRRHIEDEYWELTIGNSCLSARPGMAQ